MAGTTVHIPAHLLLPGCAHSCTAPGAGPGAPGGRRAARTVQASDGGPRRRWRRWGRRGGAQELPDTARAAAADGGELPEGAASLVRGGKRLAVRLLGVGHMLGGILDVGEHVLGGTTWRPRAWGLRAP